MVHRQKPHRVFLFAQNLAVDPFQDPYLMQTAATVTKYFLHLHGTAFEIAPLKYRIV
jgi:hypothetical protein